MAWLNLADGEELYLEVGQAYATAAKEPLRAVQVKDTQANVTINSPDVCQAINEFIDLVKRNAGRCVHRPMADSVPSTADTVPTILQNRPPSFRNAVRHPLAILSAITSESARYEPVHASTAGRRGGGISDVAPGRLVEDIANRLRPGGEGLIEKDWHVVRAIRTLAQLDRGHVQPVFSGGTSLSIGWGLIKRFSEDVDLRSPFPKD